MSTDVREVEPRAARRAFSRRRLGLYAGAALAGSLLLTWGGTRAWFIAHVPEVAQFPRTGHVLDVSVRPEDLAGGGFGALGALQLLSVLGVVSARSRWRQAFMVPVVAVAWWAIVLPLILLVGVSRSDTRLLESSPVQRATGRVPPSAAIPHTVEPWLFVTVLGGLASAAAATFLARAVARRGAAPTLGARHELPRAEVTTVTAAADPAIAWNALDAGRDPTT